MFPDFARPCIAPPQCVTRADGWARFFGARPIYTWSVSRVVRVMTGRERDLNQWMTTTAIGAAVPICLSLPLSGVTGRQKHVHKKCVWDALKWHGKKGGP